MASYELIAVPPGKIASVVTSLEMTARPAKRPVPASPPGLEIRRVERPDLARYRALFRRVGEEWLWFSRLRLSDAALAAIVHDPRVELHVAMVEGRDEGILELDFRVEGEVELAFFGLAGGLVGRGAGRALMEVAIERAWAARPRRFWVHTCTLDHPGAVAFYMRSGFVPYRRQIEIEDDPRLDGTADPAAAAHHPVLPRPRG